MRRFHQRFVAGDSILGPPQQGLGQQLQLLALEVLAELEAQAVVDLFLIGRLSRYAVLSGAPVFTSAGSSAAPTPIPYKSPKIDTAIIECFITVSYFLLDMAIMSLAIQHMLLISPDTTRAAQCRVSRKSGPVPRMISALQRPGKVGARLSVSPPLILAESAKGKPASEARTRRR